jgi:hypothetical protein
MSALSSERAASIVASSKEAGQQLAGAVQQLQGSQQSIAAAAGDSHKADTALAIQLASAAGKIGEETTGGARLAVVFCLLACLLACLHGWFQTFLRQRKLQQLRQAGARSSTACKKPCFEPCHNPHPYFRCAL